jgi:hypothetical protein
LKFIHIHNHFLWNTARRNFYYFIPSSVPPTFVHELLSAYWCEKQKCIHRETHNKIGALLFAQNNHFHRFQKRLFFSILFFSSFLSRGNVAMCITRSKEVARSKHIYKRQMFITQALQIMVDVSCGFSSSYLTCFFCPREK